MNTTNNMSSVNQPPIYPMNNVPQKTSSGCWPNVLKVGCGFLAGIAVTIFAMIILANVMGRNSYPLQDEDKLESVLEDVDENEDIRYFDVKTKKGEARIHTGMPKDSVIMLLGKPSQFMSTEYSDEITYEFGPYDINMLTIQFKDGKVSSVIQL